MQGMNGMDGMMGGWGPIWMIVWLLILLLVLAPAVYGLVRLFQDLAARRGGPDGTGKP
jgi:hypothetical protein